MEGQDGENCSDEKTFQKVDNSRRNAGGEERSYMVS